MDLKVLPNIRKTCRTCLRVLDSRKDLISISDVDHTYPSKMLKISEMLASITNLTPLDHDALPTRICITCVCQVRSAFFFKSQAENAHNVLLNQLKISNGAPAGTIKQEASALTANSETNNSQNGQPGSTIVESSENIENTDADAFADDMLVEIEPPKIQERFNGHLDEEEEEEEESDDQEENVDYEPDEWSNNGDVEMSCEDPQASKAAKGKSPDSGISDEFNKLFSTDFNQLQLAESQRGDLRECVCNICNKQMISMKALLRHKRNFHSENKCKYCRRKFGNRFCLKMHTRFKHPQKFEEFQLNGQTNAVVEVETIATIPECDSCGAKFCEPNALRRHHADCDKKCIECGLKVPQKNLFYLHFEKEHNIKLDIQPPALECPFGCLDKFFSEKVLQTHVQRCHPEDKDSIADTISDGDDGESVSSETSLECEFCHHRFAKPKSLVQHIAIMHKGKPKDQPKTKNQTKYTRDEFVDKFMVSKSNDVQRCIPCKKDIHRRSLMVHLKGKHASMKCFRCELCPESFFRADYRVRHMSYIHPTQYRCNRCEMQFDRAFKYDTHMARHGVKAKNFKPEEGLDHYDLPMTNMKFIEDVSTYDYSKQDMQRRMSILGPSSTPVEIPIPRDEFIERYLLNISDKQSHCTICQQKIMKSSILTHLLWKHAFKKPLKCAFCNERVVKTNGRLNHMARCHPNEYKCRDCNEQFAKHADLAQHMREDHNKKLTTSPSSGEEPDIAMNDIRFVSQKNEEEIIEEAEMICMEPDIMHIAIKESDTTKFKCNTCDKSFTSAKNLMLHNSHKHKDYSGQTSKQALENSDEPMTFEEFRYHYSESFSDTDVKCLVCDCTLKKKNFTNHVKSRHATVGAYKCAVCPETFFRPEHRIQHMAQSHQGMFYCQTCNIQFYRNSRYAKHMKDLHEIEIDGTDEYEVDLCLIELKFSPFIKKSQEDEQNSSLPSIVHEPEPEVPEEAEPGEGMSRDDFLSEYIKIVNKDTRRCLACEKTIQKSSMYNHLMRYHALTPPFKCPFCDLRLERAPHRIRHLQIFHPDDYKCQACGIQFQKHSTYVDHMMVEHNEVVTTPRAEGEKKDLSTLDIKYLPYLSREDSYWQEEETSLTDTSNIPKAASTPLIKDGHFLKPPKAESTSSQKTKRESFLKPQIKEEPKDSEYSMEHSIFGSDHPLVEVESAQARTNTKPTEYTYLHFKSRFLGSFDSSNVKCLVCKKKILKTSVSAHMRLHHAITLSYNCELCPEGYQRSDYRQRHMKFAHEDDFKCSYCDLQFYRSVLYKQHMTEFHKMTFDVPELKKKEEIDVPLETMKFVEHLPDEMKIGNGELNRKSGRPVKHSQPPINPEAGGLTFTEFTSTYIQATGDAFNCKICGPDTTFTKYNLKKHLKRCHATTEPFFCELCPEGFNKPDDRTQHMATAHESDFKCVHCNEQFYMSTDYVIHMKDTHRVTITLQAGKKRSEIDVPLERLRFVAEKLREDSSTTRCLIPKKSFSGLPTRDKNTYDDVPDDGELTRQQFFGKFFRCIKGKKKTKCLACTKIFSSNNRLFHAWHNHGTRRPFYCEFCPKGFFQTIKRLKHISLKHPDTIKCTECSLQFDRSKKYANHMMTEHQITVEVPDCIDDDIDVPADKLKFTKKLTAVRALKEELKDLEATSSASPLPLFAQGPVKCNDCDEDFDSSRAYRNHLRNHTCGVPSEVKEIVKPKEVPVLEYNHQCDICEKKFAAAFALNAHRKFKHFRDTLAEKKKRVFREKIRYEVHCEICDFVSQRRDYVEHHVKQVHKPEFYCRHCKRTISNFNYYMYHIHEHHPRVVETLQTSHKCSDCKKGFRSAETLDMHKKNKHGPGVSPPEYFCFPCGVGYKSSEGLEVHYKNIYHLAIVKFLDNPSAHVPEHSKAVKRIKTEPVDAVMVEIQSQLLFEENDNDPLENMLVRKLRSSDEPPMKRARLASPPIAISTPSTTCNSPSTTISATATSDDDKLEYLQFLQCIDGVFKCGICGKTKKVRKYMLHHLKQHDEVPTYGCSQCPEKFLFKKKYEIHLKSHETTEDKYQSADVSIDEHPRFQETTKVNEINCQICQLSFKLTIMLNRHNSTWHGEENPDKDLSMNDQKAKNEKPKQELAVIKLLKCKYCLEAFIKPIELNDHLKTKHDSESIEQLIEIDESGSSDEQESNKTETFTCEKCKIVFHEKKFLDNHQKFFCMYRQSKNDQVVNEQ